MIALLGNIMEWSKPTQLYESRNFTKKRLDLTFQLQKPASIACKIAAVSNLKFLKLLPGPVSGGWESDATLVNWLSRAIVLLPIELFFAFHTQTPRQKKRIKLARHPSFLKKFKADSKFLCNANTNRTVRQCTCANKHQTCNANFSRVLVFQLII